MFYKALLLISLLSIISTAQAGSISGQLKLPTPYTQTGNMEIFVRASSTTTNHSGQQLVTITPAQAIAGGLISFSISGLNNGEDYRLTYSCDTFSSPEPCENIVGRAYYKATNQSVFREAGAFVFSGITNYSNVELPIMTGNTITGTMNYFDPQVAPTGGIKLTMSAFTVNPPVSGLSVESFIEAGQPLDNYQIMIPDDSAETWRIGYNCLSFRNTNGACDDFLPSGYFNSAATNTTVELRANGEALPGGQSSSGIDLTLLGGFTITGTLSIPTPPTEAGGITLTMRASDINNPVNDAEETVTIPQGGSSVPFEILIPQDASSQWSVRYDCQAGLTPVECNKYIGVGYFDSSVAGTMTSTNLNNADLLTGGQSHSGINFSIITGSAITGKLVLSDGVAPAGGVKFTVRATNTSGGGGVVSSQIQIAENQSEVDFQLNVDTDVTKQWRISFKCTELLTPVCLEIADEGYFDATTGNTVDDSANATSLAGGVSHSNINLVVESSALRMEEICVPIKASNDTIAVVCL